MRGVFPLPRTAVHLAVLYSLLYHSTVILSCFKPGSPGACVHLAGLGLTLTFTCIFHTTVQDALSEEKRDGSIRTGRKPG